MKQRIRIARGTNNVIVNNNTQPSNGWVFYNKDKNYLQVGYDNTKTLKEIKPITTREVVGYISDLDSANNYLLGTNDTGKYIYSADKTETYISSPNQFSIYKGTDNNSKNNLLLNLKESELTLFNNKDYFNIKVDKTDPNTPKTITTLGDIKCRSIIPLRTTNYSLGNDSNYFLNTYTTNLKSTNIQGLINGSTSLGLPNRTINLLFKDNDTQGIVREANKISETGTLGNTSYPDREDQDRKVEHIFMPSSNTVWKAYTVETIGGVQVEELGIDQADGSVGYARNGMGPVKGWAPLFDPNRKSTTCIVLADNVRDVLLEQYQYALFWAEYYVNGADVTIDLSNAAWAGAWPSGYSFASIDNLTLTVENEKDTAVHEWIMSKFTTGGSSFRVDFGATQAYTIHFQALIALKKNWEV